VQLRQPNAVPQPAVHVALVLRDGVLPPALYSLGFFF